MPGKESDPCPGLAQLEDVALVLPEPSLHSAHAEVQGPQATGGLRTAKLSLAIQHCFASRCAVAVLSAIASHRCFTRFLKHGCCCLCAACCSTAPIFSKASCLGVVATAGGWQADTCARLVPYAIHAAASGGYHFSSVLLCQPHSFPNRSAPPPLR